ncbi:jg25983 [Pararge aegeria aegeria]|uniref:Jg25983 protein n=1 Tax=Pararge aegeria aegeria TaxID=348720 RepID=A0A8S4RGB0_9NEOP|nr:jg25983 [Pararge aegeria aegeria]
MSKELEDPQVPWKYCKEYTLHGTTRCPGKMEGERGRSPTRWTNMIKAATQTSIVQCSRKAEDRNKWRRIAEAAAKKKYHRQRTLLRVND